MHRILLILTMFALIVFSGCDALKNSQKTVETRPDWVDKRPSSGMYYIGIGSARKAGLSPDAYKENARNSALNVLSSEVSIICLLPFA